MERKGRHGIKDQGPPELCTPSTGSPRLLSRRSTTPNDPELDHHLPATPPTPMGPPLAYLSLHFFLPIIYYHLVASLQPPCLSSAAQLSLKNSTLSPVVSGHSCVSRCRLSCIVRSHQCSKPGISASTFGSFGFPLFTGQFLFPFIFFFFN